MASRDLETKPTLHSRRPERAGRSPSARWLVLCAVVVTTALVTATAAQSKPVRRLDSPQLAEIARASTPIVDTQLTTAAAAVAPAGYWGGQYSVATGESVTVYASNSYPVDAALGQRWADFLATLVHGPELSSVTVLLATPEQISRTCGQDAVACYSSRGAQLYAPGEDPGSDLSAEAVITHEYGHHIAANRSNAPWLALDWGPKRWASSMQVCAKARTGVLVPGAEDPVQYTENPGEGWAEAYRVHPTAAALTAAERDVTAPWSAGTTTTQSAVLTRTKKSRTFTVGTQLDGTLRMTLRAPAGMRVSVDVFAGSTRATHVASTRSVSRTFAVCGARSYRFRVTELAGRGTVSLTVAKP
jgi:hypothetical protein